MEAMCSFLVSSLTMAEPITRNPIHYSHYSSKIGRNKSLSHTNNTADETKYSAVAKP